jgi:hypothetical protein
MPSVRTGHWFVEIEPLPLIDKRVPLGQLEDRVSQTRIALRGWDYPHLGTIRPIDRGIESQTEWQEYVEQWRFLQSGFFAHRWRMREDGSSDRAGTLDFISSIWSMTEIWLFARSLFGSDDSVADLTVRVELDGLEGRRMTAGPEYWLTIAATPRDDSLVFVTAISSAELRARAGSMAVDWAHRLCHFMGALRLEEQTVRDHQERLISKKFA